MSTSDTTATDKRDVYARVTAQIINAIEQGVGTWRMPWHTSGRYAFSPINVTSKKPYRGINTVCLWAAAQAKGLRAWRMGYLPAMAGKGAPSSQGREGHAGSVLEVRERFQRITRRAETSHSSRLLFTRGYSVFNAAQVDGYTPKVDADTPMPERIAHAEAFFRGDWCGCTAWRESSLLCACSGSHPDAAVPAHSWKAWPTIRHLRMNIRIGRRPRPAVIVSLGKRFGDNAYAAEELIAELGAAFTCAHLGLSTEPREDHAQYLASWLKVLKADSKAIFTAASKAQHATDWMIARAGESVRIAEVAA